MVGDAQRCALPHTFQLWRGGRQCQLPTSHCQAVGVYRRLVGRHASLLAHATCPRPPLTSQECWWGDPPPWRRTPADKSLAPACHGDGLRPPFVWMQRMWACKKKLNQQPLWATSLRVLVVRSCHRCQIKTWQACNVFVWTDEILWTGWAKPEYQPTESVLPFCAQVWCCSDSITHRSLKAAYIGVCTGLSRYHDLAWAEFTHARL